MRAERGETFHGDDGFILEFSYSEAEELMWFLAEKGAWTPNGRPYKSRQEQEGRAHDLWFMLKELLQNKAEIVDGG